MTEIKLDFDDITTRDIELIFQHRGWLIKYFGVDLIDCTQTTNGYHVRIETHIEVHPTDVLLLQILMGSDIKREIFNFIRKHEGLKLEVWNKLYTKKMILLKTQWKDDISTENFCPVLQKKVITAIAESQDLEGFI